MDLPKSITLSVDVTKLDKARFKHVTKKDGTKAIYADLVLIQRTDNYGNHYLVKQSLTKEERGTKVELPILGNGRVWGYEAGTGAPSKPGLPAEPTPLDQTPF